MLTWGGGFCPRRGSDLERVLSGWVWSDTSGNIGLNSTLPPFNSKSQRVFETIAMKNLAQNKRVAESSRLLPKNKHVWI